MLCDMKKIKTPARLKRSIIIDGIEIPKGAILADLLKQAPNNSWYPPKFYQDQNFTCQDCGIKEVWTAEQQWKYFEVWKKPIYGQAIRCHTCRKKEQRKRIENKKNTVEGLKKKKQQNHFI